MVAHRTTITSTIPTEITSTTSSSSSSSISSSITNNSKSSNRKKMPTTTNKKLPPSSPLRNKTSNSPNTSSTHTAPPNRARLNSRDIPRSYSGLYGEENDLLPFELNRKQHTDWLESKLLLATYLAGILLFKIVVTALLDHLNSSSSSSSNGNNGTTPYTPSFSWTITNATHCLLSTIYLHWLKGSIFDDQGEMAALTLWEQLEGRSRTTNVKRVLTLVPTLLAYAACHFGGYAVDVCVLNTALWIIHVVGKLPYMNGRRLFGINATTGIDDGIVVVEDDDDDGMEHKNRYKRD
eukprot:CAMPEP_0117037238 /NCGR_PEP_ID=MMETSP0472-20121206/26308_1 /TAXON_ID=693140 ORGANISM="Tiarina fusus, Strain LIS" /NCGR_SAMPLE_ID=MMETSP0472 /ASSEMBLY_ACC=CAM_ASM_000603 /LENGTH=293 /DNA_ID=CAMNT_0004747187 /DNA_START=31 /DNA_END=912 /DNA_ORIENTATION=-